MPAEREFDVIVIGAGPTGENVADRVVQGGLSAAIVESELVGGECSYWACMPSKALLRPLHALWEAKAVGGSRQAVTGNVDVDAVFARRDDFTSHWDDSGQVRWLDGAHVALVRGHGRLAGVRRVEVAPGPNHDSPASADDAGPQVLTARHAVVIATGSDAAVPAVPGLEAAQPWTSRQATSAQTVPGRLVVMGGGVVGCEMAQVFAGLGSHVTILERGGRLLAANEPFAGELVAQAMAAHGVDVRTGTAVEGISRSGSGPVTVTVSTGELEADEILVAAGRQPRTADIGLDRVGLVPGSWLEVDDSLVVTSVPDGWLYAAGDVNHRALLTHQGKYQARACGDAIVGRVKGTFDDRPWSRFVATADHRCVPQVVFTDPEVGAVGLTEVAAQAAGINVKAVDFDMGDVAGAALYADGYQGKARLVVDEDRQVIVGATFVGPGAGELVHAATVAIVGEVPMARLWHAVPSYPTMSEVWLRLLEAYGL